MDASESGVAPARGQDPEPHAAATAAASNTSSPSNKRARDFAADLKGLTPSDDEGEEGRHDSSPRAKKQRVEESNSDHDAQSTDDGEVSESDEGEDGDGESPKPSGANRSSQSPKASLGVLEKPTSATAPVNVNGYNPGISLGVRTSFAARRAANGAPSKSTPLFASALPQSDSPEATKHSVESEADEDDDDEAEDGDDKPSAAASRATSSTPASAQAKSPAAMASKSSTTFNSGGVTWTVPETAPFSIPKNSAMRKPAGWRSVLDAWIVTFLKANMEHADDVNKQVLVTSLNSYINISIAKQLKGGKNGKNPTTKAKSAVVKMWAGIDERALGKLIADSKQDAQRELEDEESSAMSESDGDTGAESEQEEGEASELDTNEELRQQQLYYPGAADPAQCCLYCSGVGHRAKQCPQRSCRFCSSSKHTSYGCPTKRRCSRCYALGHSSKSCSEKLALSAEERDPCAFCGAPHVEAECTEIWRSYNPGTVVRKMVKSIPTFCFTCGHQGHYGPECGLPNRGPKISGPTTWSQANRDLYVDPESDAIAIGWASIDSSSATAVPQAFHIRGHAGPRRTHTHFVSSDDSEDDGFIHEPIRNKNNSSNPNSRIPNQQHQGRPAAGSIRISSNISSGGPPRVSTQSHRRRDEREFSPPPYPSSGGGFSALSTRSGGNSHRGGDGSNWQPPLPPGPPPPSGPSSMPSGYANLPPRPNTSGSHRSNGGGGGGGGGGGRNHGPPQSRARGGGGPQRSQNRGRGGGGGGGGRGRGGRR